MASDKIFRIGVDVDPGESDTPNRGIRSAFKSPTTPDVTEGITKAVEGALSQCDVPMDKIGGVMIGTTHFINAVVQADEVNLRRLAVMRICGPYSRENPAFGDFPPILSRLMNGHVSYLDGGLEYDTREIMPLNEAQIRDECRLIKEKGIDDIAIVGIFSPLDTEGLQEAKVYKIVKEEIPNADIVCSRDVGQLGFLERENATILNTSILKFARTTIQGFKLAMRSLGIRCPLFLTQNDGTIIDAAVAEKCPIKTFSSGPTNSMSGAAYLAGLDTAGGKMPDAPVIVADIGGTTMDVCALLPSGFPRQAGTWVDIGGVRSSFSMPEVVSVALGGGTKVEEKGDAVHVGPESVGHRLTTEALVFGGSTLTTTDIVVAAGKEKIGDVSKVRHVPAHVIEKARASMKNIMEKAIDSMKLSADPAVVIVVGGGSIVNIDQLDGVCELIRPQFHDCANAVGAAIAKVSGSIDVVKVLEGQNEEEVVNAMCEEAKKAAIEAGADPATVKIIELDNMPLQYVQMRASRIVARAVGLNLLTSPVPAGVLRKDIPIGASEAEIEKEAAAATWTKADKKTQNSEKDPKDFIVSAAALIDVREYRPEVDKDGTWWVSEVDCEFLSMGCSILACGGGGPGYLCYMAARAALKAGHRLPIVDIDTLPEDDYIMGSIAYGAPTVTLERIASGTESIDATEAVLAAHPGKKMVAQAAIEIGGMNGIRPLLTALHYNVPTIDGDYMGRAYPRLYILTPYLYDMVPWPCTQADGMGNTVTVNKAKDFQKMEKIHRKAGQELGLFSEMVIPPISVKDTKRVGTLGTTSLAWYIGRAVYLARQQNTSIGKAIIEANPSGRVLYTGKIVSVQRYVSAAGYTEGKVRLRPLGDDEREYGDTVSSETRDMVLPFQNEYLYAELVEPSEASKIDRPRGEILCTVPDLISLVGSDGYALGTQDLRYGVRVSVVAFVAHPHWYTPRGIKLGGPEEFGYKDLEFVPLGNPYYEPKRVTKEFRPE
ncbi:N-methylhydantoinase A/oxoprolinase/acetone carboxylase, beta subunit [Geosmithia morbida]|uniref:N-methylhydantoinase A/oxoprolinase/acetone carboxylase, beta subunit n=1 Tax=Geosmithia morbida TaxID=1094350 RepID=A0A9P4Z117_9HYPO|nr:N-methylhydantoinase A/oxoprolinase/acetone carboxylase, beta subunit [Geosmithia morbida]KAF4125452.1 N-methylhydantoinase A/oxoprolinase/acetone carboxylase, beta subunit [Geosmithia morbida]